MSVKRSSKTQAPYRLTDADKAILSQLKADYVVSRANNTRGAVYRKAYEEIKQDYESIQKKKMEQGKKKILQTLIEKWFHVNCRKRRKDAKTGTRNYSAREIFCKEKENKDKISERANKLWLKAKKKGKEFSYYQRAVTELFGELPEEKIKEYQDKAIRYSEMGPPMDIRIHNGENNTEARFLAFAEDLYKHNYVRFVAYAAYKDSAGGVTVQLIDFNDMFGTEGTTMEKMFGPARMEETGFGNLFDDFCEVAYSDAPGRVEQHRRPAVKKKESSRVVLKLTKGGEPVIPNPSPKSLPFGETSLRKYQAKLLRTYVSLQYGRAQGISIRKLGSLPTVPWGDFITRPREYVMAEYLPDWAIEDLRDPGIMRMQAVEKLLKHLYQRQQDGLHPLLFHHYKQAGSSTTLLPSKQRNRDEPGSGDSEDDNGIQDVAEEGLSATDTRMGSKEVENGVGVDEEWEDVTNGDNILPMPAPTRSILKSSSHTNRSATHQTKGRRVRLADNGQDGGLAGLGQELEKELDMQGKSFKQKDKGQGKGKGKATVSDDDTNDEDLDKELTEGMALEEAAFGDEEMDQEETLDGRSRSHTPLGWPDDDSSSDSSTATGPGGRAIDWSAPPSPQIETPTLPGSVSQAELGALGPAFLTKQTAWRGTGWKSKQASTRGMTGFGTADLGPAKQLLNARLDGVTSSKFQAPSQDADLPHGWGQQTPRTGAVPVSGPGTIVAQVTEQGRRSKGTKGTPPNVTTNVLTGTSPIPSSTHTTARPPARPGARKQLPQVEDDIVTNHIAPKRKASLKRQRDMSPTNLEAIQSEEMQELPKAARKVKPRPKSKKRQGRPDDADDNTAEGMEEQVDQFFKVTRSRKIGK
ncbi:hypothetical protein BKA70DRAFT_1235587 [Coprinopsis sp. MPI-PUGE-AT-0042]|nr:hypothetical protein BKA70DRAFT_1235587 [Coprinopsis sp. MPI-PUGE-AT-0042]